MNKQNLIFRIILIIFILSLMSSILSISMLAYSIDGIGDNNYPEYSGVYLRDIKFKSWSGFSEQARWAIDYAIREWNTETGNTIMYHLPTQHSTNSYVTAYDNENRICKITFGSSESYKLMKVRRYYTQVLTKYYISEADIYVNASKPWNVNGTSTTCYDVQNCITHEFGHVHGLGHSEYAEATMYDDADLGETKKRTLHSDDLRGYEDIYG